MEKLVPHYNLEQLKRLLQSPTTRTITGTSRRDAETLGFPTEDSIVEFITSTLSNRMHFDKSMTVRGNSKVWQDVYKIDLTFDDESVLLYVKLQEFPVGHGIVISFHRSKEL